MSLPLDNLEVLKPCLYSQLFPGNGNIYLDTGHIKVEVLDRGWIGRPSTVGIEYSSISGHSEHFCLGSVVHAHI